jgi:hypothetical protein
MREGNFCVLFGSKVLGDKKMERLVGAIGGFGLIVIDEIGSDLSDCSLEIFDRERNNANTDQVFNWNELKLRKVESFEE